MSTKKHSGRDKPSSRKIGSDLLTKSSGPQGLKPESLLSDDGTAGSRALPDRSLPDRCLPRAHSDRSLARALSGRALPKSVHDLPTAVVPLSEPISNPTGLSASGFRLPGFETRPAAQEVRKPRAESREPEFESPKPEAVAVADRLHSAAIHLLRRVRKQDVATGEGPARLSALSVLVFGGPKTLGELAAAEQVKPPTMSRMVAGLAKSRLVEIAVDAGDARRMHIRATAKGRSILEKGRERRIAYLASRLDRLTPEELKSLDDAVQILSRALREWD